MSSGYSSIISGLSGSVNAILANNYYKVSAASRKSICVRMGPIKLVGAQVDFSAGLKLELAY